MATLLSNNFTASDGTPWTDAGFHAVLGTTGTPATISGNKGVCPSATGVELIYGTGYPATQNHKVQCLQTWSSAGSMTRVGGLALRCTDDKLNGYTFEIDSNFGTTRYRVRRQYNGVWGSLIGWTNIAGVTSTALDAGATVLFRAEQVSGGIKLKGVINGSTIFDTTDSSSSRLDSGGVPGVYIDSNSTGSDVTYDDLLVLDFEDEATSTPTERASGVSAVIAGKHYSATELSDARISMVRAIQSYDATPVIQLTDLNPFHEPVLAPGMWVSVSYDGVLLATGILRRTTSNGASPEGTAYEVIGAKTLAGEVPIEDPLTQAGVVLFNQREGTRYFVQSRQDQTIGDVIAWVLDNHTDGDGNLRDVGAAPPGGAVYVAGELTALDAVIPNLQISGTVLQAIEGLLSYLPSYALHIDPATRVWHFHHRPSGTATSIDLSSDHVEASLSIEPGVNYTRVIVRGQRPESQPTNLLLSQGDIAPGWDSGVGAAWTKDKQYKRKHAGTVSASGVTGGFAYVDPTIGSTFSMVAKEWDLTKLVFTTGAEAGNEYRVVTNTTGRVTLDAGAWQAGGPAVNDAFYLEGDASSPDGKDNAFANVGRLWELTDSDLAIDPEACTRIEITQPTSTGDGSTETVNTTAHVKTPNDPGLSASVKTDLPAIGLVNYLAGPCTEGGTPIADGAPIEVKVSTRTYSRSDPTVPKIVEPIAGYRGTAYSFDSAKWNGGGSPGLGDAGVKRTLVIQAPGFEDETTEGDDYRKMASAILEVTGTLARSGQVQIAGIVTLWAGLNRSVRIVETAGTRSMPTWLTTANDLWVLAVEWDFLAGTTSVVIGTLSSGRYDLGAIRQRFVDRISYDALRLQSEQSRSFLDCARDNREQGTMVGAESNQPECASQVLDERGKSVEEWWDIFIDWVEELWSWLEAQKGYHAELDDAGNLWVQSPDGTWRYSPAGTDDWFLDGDQSGPSGGINVPGDTPDTDPRPTEPDDLGPQSIEGRIWAGLKALISFLAVQKGWAVAFDNDGNLWVGKPGGPWYYSEDGGGTWKQDAGAEGPSGGTDPGDAGVASPFPTTPGDLDPQSIEGRMWASTRVLLEMLTKQKGWVVSFDSAGNLWLGKTASGPWWYTEDGGGTWKADGDNAGPAGGPSGGDLPAGAPYPTSPGDLTPSSIEGKIWAVVQALRNNKAHLERMLAGHTPGDDTTLPTNYITTYDGSVYAVDSTGAVKQSGSGLAGPMIGGLAGLLVGLRGAVLDGKGAFASGPGHILTPGATVGVDGGYYHPPTNSLGDVMQLSAGDTVPANTDQQTRAALSEGCLLAHDMTDPGGPVFYDESHTAGALYRYWRCDPATDRFLEVSSTPGAGLNGGDWTAVSPAHYHEGFGRGSTMKRSVRVATTGALPVVHAEPTLTHTGAGALVVDGVTLQVGERVLVKDQTAQEQNGLFIVVNDGTAGAWVLRRSLDTAREDSTLTGALVWVRQGSTQPWSLWGLFSAPPITPGVTPQAWVRFGPFASASHTHDGSAIVSGLIAPAYLGSGSPSSANFLRGDGTWDVPTAGAGGGANQIQWNSAGSLAGSASLTYDDLNATVSTKKIALGVAGTTLGQLTLAGNTSGVVTVQPDPVAGTWSLTLPTSGGSSGQYLQTDGTGVSTWANGPGPGGASGQVQFNSSGAFAGDSGLTFNGSTDTLSTKVVALGSPGISAGSLTISGSAAGTITITGASSAGTYTLTLPTSAGSSGQYLQTNGSGTCSWATVATDPWTVVKLGSDFTTSNSAQQTVTGLAFTPSANTDYVVEFALLCRSATTGVAVRPGLTWPSGLTGGGACTWLQATGANTSTTISSAGATTMTTTNTAWGTANTTYLTIGRAVFRTGASPSGTLQVTLASETSGTNVTIQQGSSLSYRSI